MQEAHMSSPNTRTIAEEFFAAWTTGDFDTARRLLHDDVSFQGPIDAFDNAEAYLAALRGLSQIVNGAEQQHVFVDGDDVCVIYDLITSTPPAAHRPPSGTTFATARSPRFACSSMPAPSRPVSTPSTTSGPESATPIRRRSDARFTQATGLGPRQYRHKYGPPRHRT
jgi:hypothetical protein